MDEAKFSTKTLPIIEYGALLGPRRDAAVRQLTKEVRESGDTMVLGSMEVKRNRFRGQFRPGWIARCRAIRDGQRYGLGHVMEVRTWAEQQRFIYHFPQENS